MGKNFIKIIELYTENIGKSNKERLKEEIAAHKSLMESEHVVKLYDVMEEKDGYYLFMEMCDIDLGKFIKKNGSILFT
jgi:serine/threonine protein kinase